MQSPLPCALTWFVRATIGATVVLAAGLADVPLLAVPALVVVVGVAPATVGVVVVAAVVASISSLFRSTYSSH